MCSNVFARGHSFLPALLSCLSPVQMSSGRTLYFCAVAKGDVPIYEAHLTSGHAKLQKDDLIQFIVHAALDAVDQKVWGTTSMYLKDVDKFNDLTISGFCTAGHIKFLLLHDHRTEEAAIKQFFYDVYETYVKVALNPFCEKNTPITSKPFDDKVKAIAKKNFGLS
jgi:trafficking protein particle complex subunit 2